MNYPTVASLRALGSSRKLPPQLPPKKTHFAMLQLLLLLVIQTPELSETLIRAPRFRETVTSNAAKLTVISGEQLRKTGRNSLPRAIGQAAGVWIQETNYGGGAPVIRGLLGNQILILVDGVRLNDSTTRFGPNQSLNTIDPAIVERVEIIRGSSSVKYGSDAIGGVISIWTKRRKPASQDGAEYTGPVLAVFDGNYDTSVRGGLGSLGLSAAREDHGLLLVGSLHDFSDLRIADNETAANTGFKGHSLFGAYEYALGEKKTLRMTSRVNRDFNVPRTDRLNPGFHSDGSIAATANSEIWHYSLQDRRGYQVSFSDEDSGGFVDAVHVRAQVHSYREQRNRRKTGSTTNRFEEDEVYTLGLGVDWLRAVGSSQFFTWGIDLTYDGVDSLRRDTIPPGPPVPKAGAFAEDSEYARGGIFVQDEIFSFDPVFLTLGLRYSYFDFSFRDFSSGTKTSDSFDALTASFEAANELDDGVNATFTLAQGFRAPNLDDLANDGSFAGGDELANPNLAPEESVMAEVALAIRRENWDATVAVFATKINDSIGRILIDEGDPAITGDETYQRENTGSVELFGGEIGFRRQLMDRESAFAVSTKAALVYGLQDDPQLGENIPARRVPPFNGQVSLHYDPEVPFHQVHRARLFMNWASQQNRLHPQDVSDPRINPGGTPGWATLNFEFGGAINEASDWWVGLHNILDNGYRIHASGVDSPGARLVFGMHLRL
jgi:hemoglobin/transferrin/lactoferrin receptor protein